MTSKGKTIYAPRRFIDFLDEVAEKECLNEPSEAIDEVMKNAQFGREVKKIVNFGFLAPPEPKRPGRKKDRGVFG